MADLNDLYYFVAAVDHGGFAPAGRALGMPKSKLSRRLGQLEERLGVRLIQRTTRQFSLTELGQTYYKHAQEALRAAQAAEQAILHAQEAPRGTLRVSCPNTLLDASVGPMLVAFLDRFPQITLQLDATNRRVDVVAEGLDLAIRVRPPPLDDSSLMLKVLAERRQCLVASPALLSAYGSPATPDALLSLPSLDLGQPQSQHLWDLNGPGDERRSVQHSPRLVTRGMTTLLDAALAGIGVVQLPKMLTEPHLSSGALVHVLPGWAPPPELIHAVYPSRTGILPAARALLDHLEQAFSAQRRD